MHLCFEIPEITRLICELLRFDSDEISRSSLAAAAQTCRAWSEPALDSLWYSIEDVYPLIRCMPQDLWEYYSDEYDKSLEILRSITLSDLAIFSKYAIRVREFSAMRSSTFEAYQALHSICNTPHLLPKLKKLAWRMTDERTYNFLRFLLCPTLEDLTVRGSHDAQADLLLLSNIPSLCPNITRLSFDIGNYDGRLECLSDALLLWQSLYELNASHLPIDILWSLPRFPNLRKFTLDVTRRPPTNLLHTPIVSVNDVHTLDLEEFSLLGLYSIGPFFQLLPFFYLPNLQSLGLDFRQPRGIPSPSLDLIPSAITQFCDIKFLRTLSIKTPGAHVFTFSSFISPLLQLQALENVEIRVKKLDGISEPQMGQIASSWPHLTKLQLISEDCHANGNHTTLASLIPLARHCSRLYLLELSIDTSESEVRQELLANPNRIIGLNNQSLRIFLVHGSISASDDLFLALFLTCIFSNLRYLAAANDPFTRVPGQRGMASTQTIISFIRNFKFKVINSGCMGNSGEVRKLGEADNHSDDKVKENEGDREGEGNLDKAKGSYNGEGEGPNYDDEEDESDVEGTRDDGDMSSGQTAGEGISSALKDWFKAVQRETRSIKSLDIQKLWLTTLQFLDVEKAVKSGIMPDPSQIRELAANLEPY